MVEGAVLRERVKMIPGQVLVVPTEQVLAEKCQQVAGPTRRIKAIIKFSGEADPHS